MKAHERQLKQRAQFDEQLDGVERFLHNLNEQNVEYDAFTIELKIKRLDIISAGFLEFHNEMVMKARDAQHLQEQLDYQRKFDDRVDELSIFCERQLALCAPKPTIEMSPQDSALAKLVEQQGKFLEQIGRTSSNEWQTKLPDIKLKEFSGNYIDWPEFYDLFKSSVHNHPRLKDSQRLHFLKRSLKGEAALLIKHLTSTDENYNVAMELLVNRYEKKKHIVSKYIGLFFEQSTVVKPSSEKLRALQASSQEVLSSLKALKCESRDPWLIHVLLSKLDAESRTLWSRHKLAGELPTIEEFFEFLDKRCDEFESFFEPSKLSQSSEPSTSSRSSKPSLNAKPSSFKKASSFVSTQSSNSSTSCKCCGGVHQIYQCDKFLSMPVDDRFKLIKKSNLCINCFRNHFVKSCDSVGCKECGARHNTLLHRPGASAGKVVTHATVEPDPESSSSIDHELEVAVAISDSKSSNVFLSTAIINVFDSAGHIHSCRALLDSGSQANFLTEDFSKRIGSKPKPSSVAVNGISCSTLKSTATVDVLLSSRVSSFQRNINCLVIGKLTNDLPANRIDVTQWRLPSTIKLADPFFNIPERIDMLIGAEHFFDLLNVGQIRINNKDEYPLLQNTTFGWIISGAYAPKRPNPKESVQCFVVSLEDEVSKFWEIEEDLSIKKHLSPDEALAECHFAEHTTQDSNGRFVVRLPFRDNITELGDSRQAAHRRFLNSEKRFKRDPELQMSYVSFMDEYEVLGHMSPVRPEDITEPQYYIPHHAIFKASSTTTKVRIVFDASATSSTGVSLNDTLLTGPVVQDSLWSIMLRFRRHRVAITGDVRMHFRQVRVHHADRRYQRILWRRSSADPLQTYELNTVTYGTSCAPYLATKCIQELAQKHLNEYPLAATAACDDVYMDDVLTGSDSVDGAIHLQQQLVELFGRGCFELRKWTSNAPEVLQNVPDDHRGTPLHINEEDGIRTLGLIWYPHTDHFQFLINLSNIVFTKRTILSEISRLFDPLGLVSPIVVVAKLFMQKLWQIKLDWDDQLPLSIHSEYHQYRNALNDLTSLRLPRWIGSSTNQSIEIHGFADSSSYAYGACIYIRCTDEFSQTTCNLLCAKSRVAPLKVITIPRLELCGALLLAQLFEKAVGSLKMDFDKAVLWSDSTIVLSWISSSPSILKTFVANRSSEIQKLTTDCVWSHIEGIQNPADIVSRGCPPKNLLENELWWHGPHWLSSNVADSLIRTEFAVDEFDQQLIEAEHRPQVQSFVVQEANEIVDFLFEHFASLLTIQRVLAYCLRFGHNIGQPSENRRFGPLTVQELTDSMLFIVKSEQATHFGREIEFYLRTGQVKANSIIKGLNVFLDATGVLRVGGRLERSTIIAYHQRHPALLPAKGRLSQALMEQEHKRLMHCGPQLLLASIRLKYWPLRGRDLARRVVRKCVQCFRVEPVAMQQIMGPLPPRRIQPAKPFDNCGVDYGGPIKIAQLKFRNRVFAKAYIALFVCFTTKAVHLEAVSDLTAASFLATLRRFIARRGKVSHIHSDNGTNFVGAANEIQEFRPFIRSAALNNAVSESLSQEGIQWHFIPPDSPHVGGLWERNIRSVKSHLKRYMMNTHFTFEEFITALAQIEAILNSRPLCPLSNDANDFEALTPGHFLVGAPLVASPEDNLMDVPLNRLSRWQLVQRTTQAFWRRWSREYLTNLQQRNNWQETHQNLEVGDMVVIRDDNAPPLRWQLGRVISVIRGDDILVRKATVKTPTGTYTRAIQRLCKLPSCDN